MGRPFYSVSCELVLVLGRPCDWPDCAASAYPFLSFRPAVPHPSVDGGEHGEVVYRDGRASRRSRSSPWSRTACVRDEGRIGVTPEDLRAWAAALRPDDEVALEATDEQRRDRHAAAPAGRAGGGVQPAQDPGDRRGEGEDRQGRRPHPGPAARRRLPAAETGCQTTGPGCLRRLVMRRRPSGAATDPAEEPGARDPGPQPGADLPARRPVLRCRSPLAVRARPARRRGRSVEALLRQLDFHGDELAAVDTDFAIEAIDDPVVARLMTDPRRRRRSSPIVDRRRRSVTSHASTTPNKLVAYLGLNPRVRQSGNAPAVHGRITKTGRAQARGMLVEAAFSAAAGTRTAARLLPPRQDPPRLPDRHRRHRPQDDRALPGTSSPRIRTTPSPDPGFSHKRRKLELAAGAPSRRETTASRAPPITSSNDATTRGSPSSRPSTPTNSSSPTGNPRDPTALDDFIPGA